MSDTFLTIIRLVCGVDTDYLKDFQNSFSGIGVKIGWDVILLFLLILIILILLAVILRMIFKPGSYGFGKVKEDSITDRKTIRDIIQRSIDLRSIYDYEIMNPAYKDVYKGQALGINENNQIEVEIGKFTDINLDFEKQNVRAAFRSVRHRKQEFFNFFSITYGMKLTADYGKKKERVVLIALPLSLGTGQKRRHLRVEPSGKQAFKVRLLASALPKDTMPLTSFKKMHEGEVNDISIGGLQCIIRCRAGEVGFYAGHHIYISFRLPVSDFESFDYNTDFLVQAEVMSVQRINTGRRVMSREADEQIVGPYKVHLRFTQKAIIDRKEKLARFRPATAILFEDLSRWIMSLQRLQIQKERDTAPKKEKIKNLYPSQPLDVEKKYPEGYGGKNPEQQELDTE